MENKTVVKCSSKEQSQQVISYVRKGERLYTPSDSETCIRLDDGCYSSEDYCLRQGWKILSFEEFEQKYLGKSPKTEFIPGKWYKLSTGANSSSRDVAYINYIKYLSHKDRSFTASQFINLKGSGDLLLKNNDNGTFSDMLSIEPIDLSKIQKWLPEGHPDKIKDNNMEVPINGEYYTITSPEYSGEMIGIVTESYNLKESDGQNKRGYANFISTLKGPNPEVPHLNNDSLWCYWDTSGRRFRKATPEEKQWLDACIKANKFVPKEEALKPKEMELKKWYVIPETEDDLKLINKHFNNKFKNYVITYPDNSYDSEGTYHTHESEVSAEFVKISMNEFKKQILKQEEEEKWIPKVGDWIYIKHTGFNVKDNLIGEVKQIKEISFGDSRFDIKFEKGHGHGHIENDHGDSFYKCFRKALPEEIPSEIPEYVECENNGGDCRDHFKISRIYRTIKEDNRHLYLLDDNSVQRSVYQGLNHSNKCSEATYFKPSTKEAYEKQNTPKMEENDDWCVKCTKENKNVFIKWLKDKTPHLITNIDAYYGIKKGELWYGSWSETWGKLLSTEEFYEKIGHKVEKLRKFSLGKIRFKGLKGGDLIGTWDTNGPSIRHGDIVLHKDYDREGAEIVGFYENFYEVKYRDIRGNHPILGFTEDQLEEFTPVIVGQAPAIIQPVLKSLEENDERIDSSINFISSVSNKLVLEEV